ncbi:hypothetical protein [Streptomyces sp. NPDC006739]|uniref:hypothetical protein n=1 Tax=Streptomyces sp. NPDC006739 TaxID=3364763 RepID=UPI003681130A
MSDAALLERAADCYLRGGLPSEAARCLREAGAYRRSAELWLGLGEFMEAAADYVSAGMTDLAVWVIVHEAGDAATARAVALMPWGGGAEASQGSRWDQVRLRPARVLSQRETSDADRSARDSSLRMRLALARCDIAEGRSEREPLAALAAAMDFLASPSPVHDRIVEGWAVATAESMRRYDQVALLFAAAVRGGRGGAAQRWTDWAARVLRCEITLPDPPADDRLQTVRPLRQG